MPQLVLPIFLDGQTLITPVLTYEKRDGLVYYFHATHPLFSHAEDDIRSFRMFTASLVVNGCCKQVDIIKAFAVPPISVKRAVKKLREGGPAAFFRRRSKRKPRVLTTDILKQAQELLSSGTPRPEVAEKLDIKPDTLYRAVRAGRLIEVKKKINPKTHEPKVNAL